MLTIIKFEYNNNKTCIMILGNLLIANGYS